MISLLALEALTQLEWLEQALEGIEDSIKTDGKNSLYETPAGGETLDLISMLGSMRDFCKKCELRSSEDRIEIFLIVIRTEKVSNLEVRSQIRDLKTQMREELHQRNCSYIPLKKVKYFENPNPFGFPVSIYFPEAVQDIKDASNCIAADLNTAAVFHLMRVIEHGLRALAESLKVKEVAGRPVTKQT